MTEEALLFHDKDSFLAGLLEQLRKRLCELGARRKYPGKIHFWDLKLDLQPGDVIEL